MMAWLEDLLEDLQYVHELEVIWGSGVLVRLLNGGILAICHAGMPCQAAGFTPLREPALRLVM